MSIKKDVDRGLEIVAQMEVLKDELKQIEARLQKAGLDGPQIELEDAERDGRQYLAKGDKGIVPVVFTADLIVKTFTKDSAVHHKILANSQAKLHEFYLPKTTFEALFDSGKKLRAQASQILGSDAPKFVDACLARDRLGIPKSQIKVEWDRVSKDGHEEAQKAQKGSEVGA